MPTKRKLFKWKRVAIDFDGTLVESVYDTPLQTTDKYFETNTPIPAKEGAAETTAWLKEQGFEILIFTCRPDWQRKYLEGILDGAGITYDYILFYTKPLVDLYIDDKGFRFNNWQTTREWLEKNLESTSLSDVSHIGMEPQNEFEDLLRCERTITLLHTHEGDVLDVGCGSGRLWELCPDNLMPELLCGVEPDAKLLKKAKETGLFKTVLKSDKDFMIPQFDLVTLFGVLEHVEHPFSLLERYSTVNEIAGTVPNANSFHRHVGLRAGMISKLDELGPQDIVVEHKRVFRYHDFHRLIAEFAIKYGYTIRKFGTLGFKMTNGAEMMQFEDRWIAINEAATDAGLIGPHSSFGAEIYFRLEKI